MGKFKDLTGQRFGRLIVIKRDKNQGKYAMWLCKCDCGNEIVTKTYSLKSGITKSCGCYHSDIMKLQHTKLKHGMTGTRPFRIWQDMKNRCKNTNVPNYNDYGGRGIKICDKWLTFEGFWEDMKVGYSDNLSIDRIDVNGNYEILNCKWSSRLEQNNNRRDNTMVTIDGIRDTLPNTCRKYNIKVQTVRDRIRRGWTIENSIKIPLIGKHS